MYMYKSNKGIVGAMNRAENTAGEVALSFDGRVVALGKTGSVSEYADGAWTILHASGDIAASRGVCIFVDSRGYVYISFEVNGSDLFRQTAKGQPFVSVLTAPPNDSMRMVTEDDKGNLFLAAYSGTPTPNTPTFWRSTDGGDTWVDIYTNLAAEYGRHMHNVVFDKYRKILFVCGGDNGPTAQVQWSTDGGDTFTEWTGGFGQVTGMAFDADYIYFAADTATDRDLYRASEVGGTLTSVFTPPEPVLLDNGFVWELSIDEKGRIIAPYIGGINAARMFVSEKQGAPGSWKLLNESTGEASSNNYFGEWRASCSEYNHTFDGLRYHTSGHITGRIYAWRIMDRTEKIKVDTVNGSESGDGVLTAKTEIYDHEHLNQHAEVELQSDYSLPIMLVGLERISGNLKYGFTGSQTAAHSEDATDFEAGTSGFTSQTLNGGSVDLAATVNPNGGTTHARCDTTGGTGTISDFVTNVGFSTTAAQGDSVWLKGDVYINTVLTQDLIICGCWGGGINCFVGIDQSASNSLFINLFDATHLTRNYRQDQEETQKTIPINTYVSVKVEIIVHDTQGRITVYLNGEIALDVIGVPTSDISSGIHFTDTFFGARSIQTGVVVDWDNIEITRNKNPDIAIGESAKLEGTWQQARMLKQHSAQLQVSGTDNAMVCCISNEPTVVPYKLSGVRSESHNGVFVGGAVAIDNTSAAGKISNNIFTGQATSAVTETSGTLSSGGGNHYDATLGITPDANDVNGSHGLIDPVNGDYNPVAPVAGVRQRTLFDSRTVMYRIPPNIGLYEFGAGYKLPTPRKPRT